MAAYITIADITDASLIETALATLLAAKVADSEAAVVDLAKSKGVAEAVIKVDPVHRLLKQWAVAWTCKELCFDLIGKNPTDDLNFNIYHQLYKLYEKRCTEIEGQLTYEVFTGTDDLQKERTGPRTGTLLIGG